MPDLLQPAGQRGRDAAGQRPRISKAERPRTWPCKPCLRGTRYGQPARRSCASRRASRSRSGLFRSWMSWRRSRLFSSLLSVKVAAAAAAALTAVGVATAAYAGVLPGSVRRLAHEATAPGPLAQPPGMPPLPTAPGGGCVTTATTRGSAAIRTQSGHGRHDRTRRGHRARGPAGRRARGSAEAISLVISRLADNHAHRARAGISVVPNGNGLSAAAGEHCRGYSAP